MNNKTCTPDPERDRTGATTDSMPPVPRPMSHVLAMLVALLVAVPSLPLLTSFDLAVSPEPQDPKLIHVGAKATGKDFIHDTMRSGTATAQTAIQDGGPILGTLGPGAIADTTKADDLTRTSCPAPAPGQLVAVAARSFTANTVVLMADGTTKPISQIQGGDKVTSYDPGTNTQTIQTVTATWPHTDTTVTLTLADGSQIETTGSHPWWNTTTRTYTRADHLVPGNQLLTADGATLTVTGISGTQGTQPVYNLSITGPHTYYAGNTQLLVHNAPPCTQVEYGSTDLSHAAQQARLKAGDKAHNYGAAQFEDGTIITASSSGTAHTEQQLIDRANGRPIQALYTEREPCANKCANIVDNIPDVSYSFPWNPPEVRQASNDALKASIQELFNE